MTTHTRLPFSPLTYEELNHRAESAREELGGRVIAALEADDSFADFDMAFLRRNVAAYRGYQDAAYARVVRRATSSTTPAQLAP
jgi:hypothetical protein